MILAFIIGLAVGSFITVLVQRMRSTKPGILFGRSECLHCRHQLGGRDLVPLFSYFLSAGKCRYCKKPIGLVYPATELLTGLVFAVLVWSFGWTLMGAFWLFIASFLVAIAIYDFLFQEIPDVMSLSAIGVVAVTAIVWEVPVSITDGVFGAFIPLGFFGAQIMLSKGAWMGGGDLRLGALMGFLLGWQLVIVALFLSYVLGAVIGGVLLFRRKVEMQTMVPFGVFLVPGTFMTVLWGEQLLEWYLRFL
jgi:leader peptidase (prepilin peptidase) / N-methyltransferase